MLLKMSRVQIIGTRTHLDATIAALHRLGVVHIEDATASTLGKGLGFDAEASRLHDDLAFLAARIDALLHLLAVSADPTPGTTWTPPRDAHQLVAHVRAQLDSIAPSIQSLAQRGDELQAEALSLPRYEVTLTKLAPLTMELRELDGFDTAALLIDKRFRDVLGMIRVEVERITHARCELIAREVDERTMAALLVYPRAFATDVQTLLGHENITQVRLPKELAGRTFRDALTALHQRQHTIRDELRQIDVQLAHSAAQWRASLETWQRGIQNRLEELNTRTRFGATAYTFVIEGCVPARDLARLRAKLAGEVGPEAVLNELETTAEEREQMPVAFANPAPLKPFELLVRTMAMPRYGTFDPTPIMAIFLPLFFGIILGDVAYGALLFLLALWVRCRFASNATIRDLAQILMYGALWAIVFGFLYGEFLGTLGHVIGLRPLWMAREGKQILALFVFSIALGAVQVMLGLLLGLWQAWRARQRSELVKKIGMLVALCALFGMVGIATDFLPPHFFTPAVVVLLLGMVLLIIPAGPLGILLGPLELLETVGNILSYLRLAAIGLSSVYLALVANEMGGLVGNVVVGVILALLLHTLNFALGILSPTIQSLRLHYVEFFRQFYEGGGQEYRPFKMQ
jgi:V/A-type H+/Na+-transporting ATPase subunit I